jgi:hypothetical protein
MDPDQLVERAGVTLPRPFDELAIRSCRLANFR